MTDRAEVEAGVEHADLSGRTALVTGATSGVGREVALALGRPGRACSSTAATPTAAAQSRASQNQAAGGRHYPRRWLERT
jgi:NAD(P)-dependent dehydrogenase (short-subunit alcohol dehydrogenase family)